ncbi:O-antigen ligase family protein [Marivirga lumbricoides]|uniref:O-antigen ligase family protein n=1 Tax=Marivirga lumbricoides TaxID=1046115 RepID=UPI001666556E
MQFRLNIVFRDLKILCTYLWVFSIPFHPNLNTYLLVILFILIIFLKRGKEEIGKRKLTFILLLPVIPILYSVIFFLDYDLWFKALESQSGLFFIPFIYHFYPKITEKQVIKRIFKVLIVSVYFAIAICLIGIFIKLNHWEDPLSYLLHNPKYQKSYLTTFIGIHPSYISIYLLFTYVIFNIYFKIKNLLLKVGFDAVNLFLFILIDSRIGIILFLIHFFYFNFLNYKSKFLGAVFTTIICVLLFIPDFKESIINKTNNLNEILRGEGFENLSDNKSPRLIIYKCWFQLNKRIEPIFGNGYRWFKEAALECYAESNAKSHFDKQYNEHNMYLNIYNRSGIVGLLFFLIPFIYTVRIKNSVFSSLFHSLIFIMLSFFLVENVLSVQKGVVFFSFFYGLLLSAKSTNYVSS